MLPIKHIVQLIVDLAQVVQICLIPEDNLNCRLRDIHLLSFVLSLLDLIDMLVPLKNIVE